MRSSCCWEIIRNHPLFDVINRTTYCLVIETKQHSLNIQPDTLDSHPQNPPTAAPHKPPAPYVLLNRREPPHNNPRRHLEKPLQPRPQQLTKIPLEHSKITRPIHLPVVITIQTLGPQSLPKDESYSQTYQRDFY